jgi:predicted O-methyltransferase YrrM
VNVPKIDAKIKSFLDELYEFGKRDGGMWNVPPETAHYLYLTVLAVRATRILEIGTSNGYSTIWLALAARNHGGLVATLENDPRKVIMARKNFVNADVSRVVEMWQGEAVQMLKRHSGLFDLVFIDAEKKDYRKYYEVVFPMTRQHGLIIADNATSHADQMRDFLDFVDKDPRVLASLVPIGSGLKVILKLE